LPSRPSTSIKKGKSLQFIKDDREFDKVMIKRASDGLTVRFGEGAAKIEGAALAKFISLLNEYVGFAGKVGKRLRDDKVTELLPTLDLSKRADFEGDKNTLPPKLQKLEKALKAISKERAFKSVSTRFDEEHNLWKSPTLRQSGRRVLHSLELASSAEYRQMITKYRQIEANLEPPFVVEHVKKVSAKSEESEAEDEAADSDASAEMTVEEKATRRSKPSSAPPIASPSRRTRSGTPRVRPRRG